MPFEKFTLDTQICVVDGQVIMYLHRLSHEVFYECSNICFFNTNTFTIDPLNRPTCFPFH